LDTFRSSFIRALRYRIKFLAIVRRLGYYNDDIVLAQSLTRVLLVSPAKKPAAKKAKKEAA